jgi:hypothetical protein
MPTPATRRLAPALLLAALATGTLAACGDDADETTATTAATDPPTTEAAAGDADDLDAFCAAATELVGITPTAEQLADYAALAPEEIAEPVETFVAAFEANDGDLGAVFSDPEASAAADELSAFEADECGITPPGPPPGAPTPTTGG